MVGQKLPLGAGKSVILQIKLDLIWKNYQIEKYLNLFYLSSVVIKIKWITYIIGVTGTLWIILNDSDFSFFDKAGSLSVI